MSVLAMPLPALAYSFTVDDTTDAVDNAVGDGQCATAGNACTLRAAIQEANAWPGADIILVPDGTYTLSLSGTDNSAQAGDLDINDDLTLAGSNAVTINAAGIDRVFDIQSNTTVSINGVTITGGSVYGSGGGINNAGTLTVFDSTIDGNSSQLIGGGGLYSTGTLTLNNVTVSNNSSSQDGGGITINSPASTNTITLATINNNSASYNAGGVNIQGGTVSILDSTIDSNSATQTAGGILNTGTLTIDRSTISNNNAGTFGAGLRSYQVGGFGGGSTILVIRNSTISGNQTPETFGSPPVTATSGDGGGIYLGNTATFTNATITGNRANFSGGGLYLAANADLTLFNTLIADNQVGFTADPPVTLNCHLDIGAVLNGNGRNLANDNNSCSLSGTDFISANDPFTGMSALASNGGFSKTHAIAGSDANDLASLLISNDQRGVDRSSSANYDTGAYELTGSEGVWADLGIQVSAAPAPVFTGSTINYLVTVTNYGPNAAAAFNVNATLPGSMTGSAAGCTGTNPLQCSVSSLAVGASTTFTISSTVPSSLPSPYTALQFTATAAFVSQSDIHTANNTAMLNTDLLTQTDLAVNIIQPAGNVTVNQPFTYQYIVSNNGATARNVKLISQLPANIYSSTPPSNCAINGSQLQCDLGTMNSGTNNSVSLTVTPTSTTTLSNTARVNFAGLDTDTTDNQVTLNTTVNAKIVDIKLTATPSATSVVEGNDINYTYLVENLGPDSATGVTLVVTLPASGVTLTQINSEKDGVGAKLLNCLAPTAPATDVNCSMTRDMAPGTSAFVTLTLNVDVGASNYTISAVAASTLATDTAPGNNISSLTTVVNTQTVGTPQTDLSVTLTSTPTTAVVGENISYTATVRNNGIDFASSVLLTIYLPNNTTAVSVPAGCTLTNRIASCPTWTLGVNQQTSATLVVQAGQQGTYVASAEVINNAGQDPDGSNNFASVTTTVATDSSTIGGTPGFTPSAGSGSLSLYGLLASALLLLLRHRRTG